MAGREEGIIRELSASNCMFSSVMVRPAVISERLTPAMVVSVGCGGVGVGVRVTGGVLGCEGERGVASASGSLVGSGSCGPSGTEVSQGIIRITDASSNNKFPLEGNSDGVL